MRKLALIVAAIGALAVTAPAHAASPSAGGVQTERASAPASSQQADEFSSHRRRHWHRHRYRHRHWHRPHYRPHYYGWHRCRSVWRPYRGWVRVCRW